MDKDNTNYICKCGIAITSSDFRCDNGCSTIICGNCKRHYFYANDQEFTEFPKSVLYKGHNPTCLWYLGIRK